ncbi:MAG TPA: shikimate kinase [Candidatus Nanopelagicaceae bacterium]
MARAILIGAPGSGKSTIGRALARELGVTFTDTDSRIVEQERRSISEIFAHDGEQAFRIIERAVVLATLSSEAGVISLGGGAVLDVDVQNALKESDADVIFLDVGLSNVMNRIGNRNDRPLLANNAEHQWLELMSTREPIYRALANIHISTDNKKAAEVAAELINQMGITHD